MKYQVESGGKKWEVEVDGDRVVVDGIQVHATLSPVTGTPVRRLTVADQATVLAVEPQGSSEWLITRLGERVELTVVDERTAYIRSLAGGGKSGAGGGTIKAPMPGMVVKVLVESGQVVQAGTGLVVLEAMKMETSIPAPANGTIIKLLCRAGQVVQAGQALMWFETAPGTDEDGVC